MCGEGKGEGCGCVGWSRKMGYDIKGTPILLNLTFKRDLNNSWICELGDPYVSIRWKSI